MVTPQLLSQGKSIALRLEKEGRVKEAKAITKLLKAIPTNPVVELLTPEFVAERLGVTSKLILTWVEIGKMEGIRFENSTMIPATALDKYTDLIAMFDALDEEPQPTSEELDKAIAEVRAEMRAEQQ